MLPDWAHLAIGGAASLIAAIAYVRIRVQDNEHLFRPEFGDREPAADVVDLAAERDRRAS